MITINYDNLFVWLHGDIRRMNELQKIIGLDPILFASGKVFLHDKLNKRFNLTPYTFHANYLVGMEAKINALKANNLWFL